MPRAAVSELMEDPERLVLDVMDLRAYARTKEALDNAKRAEDKPDGPMAEKVMEIQAELMKEKRGE